MSDDDAQRADVSPSVELLVAPPELIFGLKSWLSRQDELRGHVTEMSDGPRVGQMGADLTGMLAVAIGAGGAVTVLAQALVAWLQQSRSRPVTLRLNRPDGTSIEIDGRDAASVEAVLRAATSPAPARQHMPGGGDAP